MSTRIVTEHIVRFYNQIRGFFPSRLPVGVSAFDRYTEKLMATYDVPTANKTSIQFVLANCILSLGETAYAKPMWYFARVLKVSAAKQVASYVFQTIKEEQRAAQQQAAATASTLTQVANVQAVPPTSS